MPSVKFDASDSLYKFICFIGICIIIGPQLFLFFLMDKTLYGTYVFLWHKFGAIFIVPLLVFTLLGILILCMGMIFWYKKYQFLIDKKNENEVKQLEPQSKDEISIRVSNKIKETFEQYLNSKRNDNKNAAYKVKDKEKNIRNEIVINEEKIYNYLTKNIGANYSLSKEVKLPNSNNFYFDIVAINKEYCEPDIIYELKFGKFSPERIERIIYKFAISVSSYMEYYNKKCIGQVIFLVKNEKDVNEIEKYYSAHISDFQFGEANIELKGYCINELS